MITTFLISKLNGFQMISNTVFSIYRVKKTMLNKTNTLNFTQLVL